MHNRFLKINAVTHLQCEYHPTPSIDCGTKLLCLKQEGFLSGVMRLQSTVSAPCPMLIIFTLYFKTHHIHCLSNVITMHNVRQGECISTKLGGERKLKHSSRIAATPSTTTGIIILALFHLLYRYFNIVYIFYLCNSDG